MQGLRLEMMNLSTNICDVCNNSIEDIEHMIFNCENSNQLWNKVGEILDSLFSDGFHVSRVNSILGIWQDGNNEYDRKTLEFINVILSITRFHIWKVRCSIKYGREQISFLQSMRQLKYSLLSHLFLLSRSSDKTIHKLCHSTSSIIERLS